MSRSKNNQARENSLQERRAQRPLLEYTLDAFRDNGFTPAEAGELILYKIDKSYPLQEGIKEKYQGLEDDEHDRVMIAARDIAKGYEKYILKHKPQLKDDVTSQLKEDIVKLFNDRYFRAGDVIENHLKTVILMPPPDNKHAEDEVKEKPSKQQIAAVAGIATVAAVAGHAGLKKWSEKRAESAEGKAGNQQQEPKKRTALFAVVGAVLLGGVVLAANQKFGLKLPSLGNGQGRG